MSPEKLENKVPGEDKSNDAFRDDLREVDPVQEAELAYENAPRLADEPLGPEMSERMREESEARDTYAYGMFRELDRLDHQLPLLGFDSNVNARRDNLDRGFRGLQLLGVDRGATSVDFQGISPAVVDHLERVLRYDECLQQIDDRLDAQIEGYPTEEDLAQAVENYSWLKNLVDSTEEAIESYREGIDFQFLNPNNPGFLHSRFGRERVRERLTEEGTERIDTIRRLAGDLLDDFYRSTGFTEDVRPEQMFRALSSSQVQMLADMKAIFIVELDVMTEQERLSGE